MRKVSVRDFGPPEAGVWIEVTNGTAELIRELYSYWSLSVPMLIPALHTMAVVLLFMQLFCEFPPCHHHERLVYLRLRAPGAIAARLFHYAVTRLSVPVCSSEYLCPS